MHAALLALTERLLPETTDRDLRIRARLVSGTCLFMLPMPIAVIGARALIDGTAVEVFALAGSFFCALILCLILCRRGVDPAKLALALCTAMQLMFFSVSYREGGLAAPVIQLLPLPSLLLALTSRTSWGWFQLLGSFFGLLGFAMLHATGHTFPGASAPSGSFDPRVLLTVAFNGTFLLMITSSVADQLRHALQDVGEAEARAMQDGRRIRQQKDALQARTRVLEHLTETLEGTPDFISYASLERGVFYSNQAMLRAAGKQKGEAFEIRDFHPPWAIELLETEAIPTACRDGMWRGETAMLDAAGNEIPVDQIILAHLGPQGEVSHTSTIMRDISVARSREEELAFAKERAEKADRAKTDFLANISHEIRTPMNAIIGLSNLLLDESLTGRQLEHAQAIYGSGRNLLSLINDILDFSKIESGNLSLHPTVCDPRAIVEDVVRTAAIDPTDLGVDIVAAIAPQTPPRVRIDEMRLRQIVLNLVSNAVKFTNEGHVLVRLDWDLETLTVEVADTGKGIAPDRLKAIFGRFCQEDVAIAASFGGTGLGLTISEQLVRLMSGHITVASTLGEGSTFRVDIPCAAVPHEPVNLGALAGQRVVTHTVSAVSGAALQRWLSAWHMHAELIVHEVSGAPAALDLANCDFILVDGAVPLRAPDLDLDVDASTVWLVHSTGVSRISRPISINALLAQFYLVLGHQAPILFGDPDIVAPHAHFQNLRCLIADDVATGLIVGREFLERLGCTVDTAQDGLDALTQWEKGEYDIVFLDYHMPKMNGPATARRIRAREGQTGRRETQLVALTAALTEDVRAACERAGMNGFLAKPLLSEALAAYLQAAFPDPVKGIAQDIEDDRTRLGQQFTAIFVQSTLRCLDELEVAIHRSDVLGIEGATHKLKGALGTLATDALLREADAIERDAHCGDPRDIKKRARDLIVSTRAALPSA